MSNPVCPNCKLPLLKVLNTGGSLNSDQFDSIKAGDWYCRTCPCNGRGNSGYAYYWNSEVENNTDKPPEFKSGHVGRLNLNASEHAGKEVILVSDEFFAYNDRMAIAILKEDSEIIKSQWIHEEINLKSKYKKDFINSYMIRVFDLE